MQVYFQLGIQHICDWQGYDHILFLLALVANYTHRNLRRIAILITAFTIGHATTLALAALDILPVNQPLVEMLIAVTILLTALQNIVFQWRNRDLAQMRTPAGQWQYGIALVFGLIHGMGFSNYFRTLLGEAENIVLPLLGFNFGIEAGQIIIVTAILLLQWAILTFGKLRPAYWAYAVSLLAIALSLKMIMSYEL